MVRALGRAPHAVGDITRVFFSFFWGGGQSIAAAFAGGRRKLFAAEPFSCECS